MAGKVFLSYVSENRVVAERLASDLQDAGVDVWLDRTRLNPGERWREAIRKSIHTARMFIACFSREYAIRDQSEMNEELTLAIEELRRRPTDQAWFIPVVIDDSEVPDRDIGAGSTLRSLHRVSLAINWDEGVASIVKVVLCEFDDAHPSFPDRNVKLVRVSAEGRPPDTASPVSFAASEPDLRLSYSLARGYSSWDRDEMRIILLVTNHARASASAPYIRLQVPSSFAIGALGVSSRQPGAPFRLIAEAAQPPAATFTAAADFVIHSTLPAEFAQVTTIVKRNMPVPSCGIRFKTAASNLVTGEGTLRIEAAEIAQRLKRSIDPTER